MSNFEIGGSVMRAAARVVHDIRREQLGESVEVGTEPGQPWSSSSGSACASGERTFVVAASGLGHFVAAAGEVLARHGGESLARWVVLDVAASEPATAAEIARLRGMARKPVQRLADVFVADGLATFKPNPRHRRAQLLTLTARGRRVLAAINREQENWANEHGARIGIDRLERARAMLAQIRPLIHMPDAAD